MTATPDTVAAPFKVNTTGTASHPNTVTLSDGNVLVAYMTELGGVPGTEDGYRIRGQILTPDGEKVGGEIAFPFPSPIRSKNFDIVAVRDNRVLVMTYQMFLQTSMVIDVYKDKPTVKAFKITADGAVVDHGTRTPGDVIGNAWGRSMTRLGETSGIVFGWFGPNVTERVGLHHCSFFDEQYDTAKWDDAIGHAIGHQQLDHIRKSDRDSASSDMTTLVNGNIVVVLDKYGVDKPGRLNILVYGPDGTPVRLDGVIGDPAHLNTHPQVQALAGGGHVIAYTENEVDGDSDIRFTIYDSNGNSQTELKYAGVDANLHNNHNEPAIAALDDGGFVIFYDKDAGQPQIRGQRFDGAGTKVGGDFVVARENGAQIRAVGLPHGVVAVAYSVVGQGTVKAAILDVDSPAGTVSPLIPIRDKVG